MCKQCSELPSNISTMIETNFAMFPCRMITTVRGRQLPHTIVKQCFFIISTHCLVMSSLSNYLSSCQSEEAVENGTFLLCLYIALCYWVTQKLPQISTVILRICIGKVSVFAVCICCNFWVSQYIHKERSSMINN